MRLNRDQNQDQTPTTPSPTPGHGTGDGSGNGGNGGGCGCTDKLIDAMDRPAFQYAGPFTFGGPTGTYRLEQLPFTTDMEWLFLTASLGGAGTAALSPSDSAQAPALTSTIDPTDPAPRMVFVAAGAVTIPGGPDVWYPLPASGHLTLQTSLAGGNGAWVTVAIRRRVSRLGRVDFGGRA